MITTDWEGKNIAGINLAWDYNVRPANQTFRISMYGYITIVILKYGYPCPIKPKLSPHKHSEVIYGAKEQINPEDDTSMPLENQSTKHVQGIVGALLYYAQSVNKKLLVSLSAIGSQQATATQLTNKAINHILDY